MEDTNRVYRIRTTVGEDAPNVIHVPLKQSYDMFEILSLKLDQTNSYKTYESDYGVIVGRVTANGGFGVPNAKVSIFIEVSDDDALKDRLLYNFTSTSDTDNNGVRYNLLPDYVDDACHQDVGTFPNKRLVLDNNDIIEMFDKYWKYTTTTNHAGDYMLFGIPTGSQQLHVDVDLSDCGILSQRPRDMIGKGYNANMFESPNKFKSSTNLNSLAQIISQDRGLYVYPYWGDVSDGDDKFSITRCDINLEYKFESYAVFMGSIVTDKGSNAIGKNCTGTEQNGKMSDLIAGEGTIEMIRKTIDGKVEEFPIMGNRLIDGDGVWCYQIPMNLDYVTTDEFGNLVPTDNPDKGIATRTRVRFRISLDENPNDATARKRARYLVPNNPRLGEGEFDETLEADYEFGSATREESYCDMFWNKVYTVKNYIPKLQKNSKETNRKHTGIKLINHYGDNNPMPYNALTIKLSFTYRLICVIVKVFILLIGFLNNLISILGYLPCWLGSKCLKIFKWKICPFKFLLKLIPSCIQLSSEFCDDGINPNVYYPGCGKPFDCVWTKKTLRECQKEQAGLPKEDQKICKNSSQELYTCVENELAQQNDATSFNFYNDWVNGVLYAPLWYRKITPKKRYFFGLFKRKAKDEWCSADRNFESLRIMQACSITHKKEETDYQNFKHNKDITPYIHGSEQTDKCKKSECNKSITYVKGMYGVIRSKETMLGQTVYYYKSIEYDPSLESNENLVYQNNSEKPNGEIKLLFATDIVLLGSLNECDLNGVPQFFKTLESTTYNLPTDILFTDHEIINEFDANGNLKDTIYTSSSEMAGCDWGNKNEYGKHDGGLFYSIGCSNITMTEKSCVNLIRICEYGVSLDETKQVPTLSALENSGDSAFEPLITDGFVSYDELYNLDERSMFATMNGNKLKTKLNNIGLYEYDFRYLYPHSFDGSLKEIMEETTKKYNSNVTYRNNFKLEEFSRDYYIFRMGDTPYFYDIKDKTFPRYENSFYFYFGLKAGKTAIEKFNSKYFAECTNPNGLESQIGIKYQANSWCSMSTEGGNNDGYLSLDFSKITTPYNLLINGVTNGDFSFEINKVEEEKIYFSNTEITKLNNEGYKKIANMIDNGAYTGVITDDDGNITEFNFNIEATYLSFKTQVQDFTQATNTIGDDYNTIASITDGVALNEETKQVTRNVGGVITVYDVFMNGKRIDNYNVSIKLKNEEKVTLNNQGTQSGYKVLLRDQQKEIYGFGVGKGDVVYEVTVTEVCNGADSQNSVTINVLVKEPIPFKMYINDVDYDLIKNFNKISNGTTYSDGWTPSNYTISNKKADLQNNRVVVYENNPWFNVNNIWSNQLFKNIVSVEVVEEVDNINTFVTQISNKTYSFKTKLDDDSIGNISLSDLIQEFTQPNVGGNVYYNWNGDYIVEDYDSNTFNVNTNQYDENNINDLISLVNEFIENVNNIITLRNELPSLMKSAFYLTCQNEQKDVNITVQTSNMPYRTTLVYQEETVIEDNDENTLSTNNMVINYEGNISNINIPTITYACNDKYGLENSLSYEPIVAEVVNGKNKYQKHAYYVGTVDDTKSTLPKGLSTTVIEGDINQINESNKLNLLFDFPIIDMALRVNYISWAFINDIPFYKKYVNSNLVKETVTMNGAFAGIVFNGNLTNDKFDTQTLFNLNLKLTPNLISNQRTYVEKRVVIGYENDETLEDMLSFQNYIVDENYNLDNTQYAPVLPLSSTLILEDENGCGINETIYGAMKIVLSDTSVNNCITGEKILEVHTENVDSDDNIYYSAISLKDNVTYPLNYAYKLSGVNYYKLDKNIFETYAQGSEQNIFSYKMTSDYFRDGHREGINVTKIVDTDFASEVVEETESGDVKTVRTEGYGTTGKFNAHNINLPVYVVGETFNHCRAISPVYDYSNVYAFIKYGILQRKEVEETVDETTGETTYNVLEPTKDYKFGIAVKKGHFYLDNYKYTLRGVCKVDEVNTIDVREETLLRPEQFIFATITENVYKILKSKFVFAGTILSGILKQVINNTEITAIDYTGLRHICGIKAEDLKNAETEWYTYIWNANMPKDESGNPYPANAENGGIVYGLDDNGNPAYYDYLEFTYEKNQTIEPMDCEVGTTLGFAFLGWTENQPNRNGPFVTFSGDNLKATESRVYFGNWDIPLPKIPVRFLDSDGTTVLETQGIEEGGVTNGPTDTSLSEYSWYLSSDATQSEVEFPQTITQPTDYIKIKEFTVNWYDTDDTLEPPKFTVHFRLTENDTQDIDTQEITAGEKVSLRGDCVNYTWYVMGDTNKTQVQFPYTVNSDITFIAHKKYKVKWVDNGEQIPPSGQEEDVYVFESVSPTQTTIAYDVSHTNFVIKTTLNGYLHNFTATVTQGEDWLSVNNIGSADAQNGTLTLNISAYVNTNHEERTGILTLVQDDSNNTITLQITQEGLPQTDGIINVRVKNSRTTGVPIDSAQITFKVNGADIIAGVGGGITSGHDRVTTFTINDAQKSQDIIADTVYIYPHSLSANFRQTPNPYVYNTVGQEGGVELFIEILDGDAPPIENPYFEPITENTTGTPSLILRQYGLSTDKNFRLAANCEKSSNTYKAWPFSTAGIVYAEFEKNNAGGVTVTTNQSDYSMVDNYGVFFTRARGYGSWQGGSTNSASYGGTYTFSTVNDTSIKRTVTYNGRTDEDNQILLRGEIVSKALRIPSSGYDGSIQLWQYPYYFDTNIFYTDPSIVYITKVNNQELSVTSFDNNISADGINATFENINDNSLDYQLTYNIDKNTKGDYKYHIIILSNTTVNPERFSYGFDGMLSHSTMLHFVQEYRVKNRVYYGNGFISHKTFDDKYNVTQSEEYYYHSWFETCSSKILTEDSFTINIFATTVAYPNSNFDYVITTSNGDELEILSDNYTWGEETYTIVKLPTRNKAIFTKK